MIDKIKGCILGLAIGDAMGAPIEFICDNAILKGKYGREGLTDFVQWHGFPKGSYTDDTQMAIATAIGCLTSADNNTPVIEEIYKAYQAWYLLQKEPFHKRFPGNTCMSSLRSGIPGSIEAPINDSKGSGGVMRVAPVGLFFPYDKAFKIGCESSALTHGHISSTLASGFMAELIALLLNGMDIEPAIDICISEIKKHEGHEELLGLINKALSLINSSKIEEDSISILGKGWVADEALAISLYCSLKNKNNFKKAIITSINHEGDSDTTGCITGAILGTYLGVNNRTIPDKWLDKVENGEELSNLAIRISEKRNA